MFHKTRFDIIDSMKEVLYCEVISYCDLLETTKSWEPYKHELNANYIIHVLTFDITYSLIYRMNHFSQVFLHYLRRNKKCASFQSRW